MPKTSLRTKTTFRRTSRSSCRWARLTQNSELNFGSQVARLRNNLAFVQAASHGSPYHLSLMQDLLRKDHERYAPADQFLRRPGGPGPRPQQEKQPRSVAALPGLPQRQPPGGQVSVPPALRLAAPVQRRVSAGSSGSLEPKSSRGLPPPPRQRPASHQAGLLESAERGRPGVLPGCRIPV